MKTSLNKSSQLHLYWTTGCIILLCWYCQHPQILHQWRQLHRSSNTHWWNIYVNALTKIWTSYFGTESFFLPLNACYSLLKQNKLRYKSNNYSVVKCIMPPCCLMGLNYWTIFTFQSLECGNKLQQGKLLNWGG